MEIVDHIITFLTMVIIYKKILTKKGHIQMAFRFNQIIIFFILQITTKVNLLLLWSQLKEKIKIL